MDLSITLDASVLVATYSQSKLLSLQLALLTQQQTNYCFEVIVCEDGSLSNSPRVIQEYHNNFPDIYLQYVWQQDRGFRAGQARNMGIRQAKGKIIILLDGDMLPTLSFVNQHIEFHRKYSKSVLTGGRKLIDDKVLFDGLKNKRKVSHTNLQKFLETHAITNNDESRYRIEWYNSKKPWKAFFSCNASFPRNNFANYNEHLIGWGIEDWDFSLTQYLYGYKIVYEENILAYHVDYKPVISNAFRNNDHTGLVEFARNTLIFIDNHPNMDITDCAIALRNYRLGSNNTWEWAGDSSVLRSYDDAIDLLRDWLSKENIYKKSLINKQKEPSYDITYVHQVSHKVSVNKQDVIYLSLSKKPNSEILFVYNDNNTKYLFELLKHINNYTMPSKLIWNLTNLDTADTNKIYELANCQALGSKIKVA